MTKQFFHEWPLPIADQRASIKETIFDHSPLTEADLEQAYRSACNHGFPDTPARWQIEFLWSYTKAWEALDLLTKKSGGQNV